MPHKYQVKLAGNQFGETYHVAAAMLLTGSLPSELESLCNAELEAIQETTTDPSKPPPISDAQNTFLYYARCCAEKKGGDPANILAKSKCTEDIIAPALRNTGEAGFVKIRNGFFQSFKDNQPKPLNEARNEIIQFLSQTYPSLNTLFHDSRLPAPHRSAIIWIRHIQGETRNMTIDLIKQIVDALSSRDENPIKHIILVGDTLHNLPAANGQIFYYDMTQFHKNQNFKQFSASDPTRWTDFSYPYQLLTFFVLKQRYGARMAIGMKSGAMDGPALIGCPTIFFDEDTSETTKVSGRMAQLANSVPWMVRIGFPADSYNSNDRRLNKMPDPTITALGEAIAKLRDPLG
ncbi:hypothetical protein [Nisaea sp.]|uniref:hypothetical protein n=1 Tax=Nisaea sp. TaxID=2024842 RepID=UPI0032631C01